MIMALLLCACGYFDFLLYFLFLAFLFVVIVFEQLHLRSLACSIALANDPKRMYVRVCVNIHSHYYPLFQALMVRKRSLSHKICKQLFEYFS